MGIQRLYLTCDWCESTANDFEEDFEAVSTGWVLTMDAITTDEDGDPMERAFCSRECVVRFYS